MVLGEKHGTNYLPCTLLLHNYTDFINILLIKQDIRQALSSV